MAGLGSVCFSAGASIGRDAIAAVLTACASIGAAKAGEQSVRAAVSEKYRNPKGADPKEEGRGGAAVP